MPNTIEAKKLKRVIGRVEGQEGGPTIVAIGGMHGNEPAGVQALQEIIDDLKNQRNRFKGRFIALSGNLAALEKDVRYIDEDMNRIWFSSVIDDIRQTPAHKMASSERRELKGILDILDDFLPEDPAYPVIIADLHSFSAEGAMFAITAPEPQQVKLFEKLHVPLIFGIENKLRGSALRYYQDRGYITIAVEGGQHQDETTIKNNAIAMLTMLDEMGCINMAGIAAFKKYEKYLKKQNEGLPHEVKLAYQHLIEPSDGFKMKPGFKNFQPIKKDDCLAEDKSGKILALCNGYMLMPLYQQQGSDGFFIVQDIDNRKY